MVVATAKEMRKQMEKEMEEVGTSKTGRVAGKERQKSDAVLLIYGPTNKKKMFKTRKAMEQFLLTLPY